jgi:16S rRNA G1207 methylase RsmC
MLGVSHSTFDANIVSIIKNLAPTSIIDLGCGKGKLGRIIKESNLRQGLQSRIQ